MNKMMKTKLRTFARKQILCKPIKKLIKKNEWNVAFTSPKHNVKPVGLMKTYHWYVFVNVNVNVNVIQTSCFFFLEKK